MLTNFHAAVELDCCEIYDPVRVALSSISDINRFCKLTEKDTHRCGRKFKRFIKKNNPKYIPVAIAIKVHRKIDHLAEKNYNGVKGGYTGKYGNSLHYLFEFWVDAWITKKRPKLPEKVIASIEEIDINELSRLFGKFFRKKEPEMEEIFPRYLDEIIAYEKAMSIKKYLGVAYNAMNHRNHEQFYSDVLRIIRGKYLNELRGAYKHDKRTVKTFTGCPMLPHR